MVSSARSIAEHEEYSLSAGNRYNAVKNRPEDAGILRKWITQSNSDRADEEDATYSASMFMDQRFIIRNGDVRNVRSAAKIGI